MHRHSDAPSPSFDDGSSVWDLTQAVCSGNRAAFGRLYDHYIDRLHRYLLVIEPRHEELVHEALQEAMMRVTRYLKPVRDERMLWGWLCRVAKTALIDVLRKERRRSTEHFPAAIEYPSEVEAESQLIDALRRSMRGLDEASRRLIEAHYVHGRTHSQIAEELGTTRKAVECRLARLRARLRPLILEALDEGR